MHSLTHVLGWTAKSAHSRSASELTYAECEYFLSRMDTLWLVCNVVAWPRVNEVAISTTTAQDARTWRHASMPCTGIGTRKN